VEAGQAVSVCRRACAHRQAKINAYGPLVLSMVGPDLCAAAGTGFGAGLTLIDVKSRQTATYSCEQQRFTSWVQIAGTTDQ
jgi:hypothetical protein